MTDPKHLTESTSVKAPFQRESGRNQGRGVAAMVWPATPIILIVAVALLSSTLTYAKPDRAGHIHPEDALRSARCPVPVLSGLKRLKEESGHEGHADVTIYEAVCPGGRRLTVTCTERTCRVDRPPRSEDGL